MKIKTITYRRGANLGDFETVQIEVSTEVGSEECPKAEFLKLKGFTDKAIQFEILDHAKVKRDGKGARIA